MTVVSVIQDDVVMSKIRVFPPEVLYDHMNTPVCGDEHSYIMYPTHLPELPFQSVTHAELQRRPDAV